MHTIQSAGSRNTPSKMESGGNRSSSRSEGPYVRMHQDEIREEDMPANRNGRSKNDAQ
jgi:hypothetical protein